MKLRQCQWNCFPPSLWNLIMSFGHVIVQWITPSVSRSRECSCRTSLLTKFETWVSQLYPRLYSLAGKSSQILWWIRRWSSDLSPWKCSMLLLLVLRRFLNNFFQENFPWIFLLLDMTTETLVLSPAVGEIWISIPYTLWWQTKLWHKNKTNLIESTHHFSSKPDCNSTADVPSLILRTALSAVPFVSGFSKYLVPFVSDRWGVEGRWFHDGSSKDLSNSNELSL